MKKIFTHVTAYPDDNDMWELFSIEWKRAINRFKEIEKKKDIKLNVDTLSIDSAKKTKLPNDLENVIYFRISMKYE